MYPRLIFKGIRLSSRNVKRMFSTNLEKKIENMEKQIDKNMKVSAFAFICLSVGITLNAISIKLNVISIKESLLLKEIV